MRRSGARGWGFGDEEDESKAWKSTIGGLSVGGDGKKT